MILEIIKKYRETKCDKLREDVKFLICFIRLTQNFHEYQIDILSAHETKIDELNQVEFKSEWIRHFSENSELERFTHEVII